MNPKSSNATSFGLQSGNTRSFWRPKAVTPVRAFALALSGFCALLLPTLGAAQVGYTITASANTGGAIDPSGKVLVRPGAARVFTVTPDATHKISSVDGTCGGTLSGTTYTTNRITADCTVTASFAVGLTQIQQGKVSLADQLGRTAAGSILPPILPKPIGNITVIAGAGGTINPSGTIVVRQLELPPPFTVLPNAGYMLSSVGGTCAGTFSGDTYTLTMPFRGDCTVAATFARTHTVTVSVSGDGSGTVSPSAGKFLAADGATLSFVVTPKYGVTSISGTCGSVLSSGLSNPITYTTKPITADCTVDVTFFIVN